MENYLIETKRRGGAFHTGMVVADVEAIFVVVIGANDASLEVVAAGRGGCWASCGGGGGGLGGCKG